MRELAKIRNLTESANAHGIFQPDHSGNYTPPPTPPPATPKS